MAILEDIAAALDSFYEKRIGPQFDRIDGRFERIDGRFERIDRQLERIDGRFERIDGQLERIDGRFESIDGRFGSIDGQFERIRDQMVRMEQDLRGEIGGSEARLRAEVDAFRRDVDAHFDALYQRLDRLETEYQMIMVALRRLESAAVRDRQERQALQAEVADLRARVNALGERLAELESRLSGPS
jgi:chromosome segregation ATPase